MEFGFLISIAPFQEIGFFSRAKEKNPDWIESGDGRGKGEGGGRIHIHQPHQTKCIQFLNKNLRTLHSIRWVFQSGESIDLIF